MKAIRKIKVKNWVADLDGDEMTRMIWKSIKDKVKLLNLMFIIAHFPLSRSKNQILRSWNRVQRQN